MQNLTFEESGRLMRSVAVTAIQLLEQAPSRLRLVVEQQGKLEPLTEQQAEDLKRRDPQQQPLTPREWEQLRQQRQRPEYSDT